MRRLPGRGPRVARSRAGHQFPQPGLRERRARQTTSFTDSKSTRKPSPPGTPPEITVGDHHPEREAPENHPFSSFTPAVVRPLGVYQTRHSLQPDQPGALGNPAAKAATRRAFRPNHKLQPAEITALVEAYQAGRRVKPLARELQLHEQTVKEHPERAGVGRRPQRVLTDAQVAEVVERYRAGTSLRQLAERYGVACKSVGNCLLGSGVTLRPAKRLPPHAASD
jgi:hypothetical protein